MKSFNYILICIAIVLSSCSQVTKQADAENSNEANEELQSMDQNNPKQETGNQKLNKFEPEDGTVLVFVGQDNLAVGGNDALGLDPPGNKKWDDGYIDHFINDIGIPAGLTHYVYMTEGKKNAFGSEFPEGVVYGLNDVHEWAAGDMCLRCYLQNTTNHFSSAIVHLSISMEFNSEQDIAEGKSDELIEELGDFLIEFSDFPFLIRIGYEFDGSWNGYDPENFKLAWKRIVDQLRARQIDNFATVLAASSMHVKESKWEAYYPGDEYVDWLGYSFFDPGHANDAPALQFARKKNKPIFIAESTPWKTTKVKKDDGDEVWNNWFVPLFDHIESNTDVVKAVSYINTEWIRYEMWKKSDVFRIDTRLELNPRLKELWIDKMNEPMYIHSTDGTYGLIGFSEPNL